MCRSLWLCLTDAGLDECARKHPFGARHDRESNILKVHASLRFFLSSSVATDLCLFLNDRLPHTQSNAVNLPLIYHLPEALHLIAAMIGTFPPFPFLFLLSYVSEHYHSYTNGRGMSKRLCPRSAPRPHRC